MMDIGKWAEDKIRELKSMPRLELERIAKRPFQPSPFNSKFDLEKWCAIVLLTLNKKV